MTKLTTDSCRAQQIMSDGDDESVQKNICLTHNLQNVLTAQLIIKGYLNHTMS